MVIKSYSYGTFDLKESEAACADPDVLIVSEETDIGRWSLVENA